MNRLALRDLPHSITGQISALVPVHSLREIANIFGGEHEEFLNVYFTDKLIFIEGLGVTLSSRLVEAQFPHYEQVLPKEFTGIAVTQRQPLIEALERVILVSSTIKINFSAVKMVITAREPDKGQAYEELLLDFSG